MIDRLSRALETRISRRSFVVRSAFAGSAVAASKGSFLLRPGTSYDALCGTVYCGSPDCSCGSTCCAGYTEFCCVLDGGYNSCPSGTVMGGWWKAEGSEYCDGARYYMDCNAVCQCSDGCGSGYGFCDTGCDGLSCGCAGGSCDNYLTGCFQFRYGQCNQDVACIGRIHCRVVTCVPPWEIEDCTTTSMEDDGTADQNASCLGPDPTYPPPPCPYPATNCEAVGIVVTDDGNGYAIGTSFGKLVGLGTQPTSSVQHDINSPVTDLIKSPASGMWLLTSKGQVIALGGAKAYGSPEGHMAGPCVAVVPTPTAKGYWVMNTYGRVSNFGDAHLYGDGRDLHVATPWVSMAAMTTGEGYWLVDAAGRVQNFGKAVFHGDALKWHIERPIVKMVAHPGEGYWLITAGGRIFEYGEAGNYGSPSNHTEAPVVDMVCTPTGKGYYVLDSYGQVFTYGDAVSHGNPG